jgi:hypothetical protein
MRGGCTLPAMGAYNSLVDLNGHKELTADAGVQASACPGAR